MATKTKVFFQISGGIVIAYHSDNIPADLLPPNESVKELETDKDPMKFIGMAAEHLTDENPPFPDPTDVEKTLAYKRQELKNLYYELKFTEELEEPTTELQALYNSKLAAYNTQKP